jgi:hypothetical protein
MKSPVFGNGFGHLILELRNGSDVRLAMTSTSWKDRIGQVQSGLIGLKIASKKLCALLH